MKSIDIIRNEVMLDNYVHKKQLTCSPYTAIRLKCFKCKHYNLDAIDKCGRVNCPLWVFRHGDDVLQGLLKKMKAANGKEWSINDF